MSEAQIRNLSGLAFAALAAFGIYACSTWDDATMLQAGVTGYAVARALSVWGVLP